MSTTGIDPKYVEVFTTYLSIIGYAVMVIATLVLFFVTIEKFKKECTAWELVGVAFTLLCAIIFAMIMIYGTIGWAGL